MAFTYDDLSRTSVGRFALPRISKRRNVVPFRSPEPPRLPDAPRNVQQALTQPQVLARRGVDNAVRWQPGERLNHLIEQSCRRFSDNDAVVTDSLAMTYRELDRRSNQVARHLVAEGVRAGDRVGLLFDKSVETYVALLAVLKVNAAYVPLDQAFPEDRLRFILQDAEIKTIVSVSAFEQKLDAFAVKQVLLDVARLSIDAQSCARLASDEVAATTDQLCYIIYTSGTTGNPKGVAVEHPSICNFVRVAAELYGYRPGDRVYQGMTIAFDFSVEETWVPLMAGCTLVPGRAGGSLVGDELAEFLSTRKVTVMACCPTLLATIETDLPLLRILLVGGEACPQNLVTRWYRPGRQILNSYGPTEGTVTATLTELIPNKPVTIGVPLSTYSIVILDPVTDQAVPHGELGEIGIAGVGVARGYLNREELTQKKFIRDFLNIANNPSGRIYRTGDLGRINDEGEIEYKGRIDTQVKIRGYRIELSEIEAVLLALPEVAQAAVSTFEPEAGQVELAAYYALKQDAPELKRCQIAKALRAKLPAYMVPAYLEQLSAIPMTLSNKADLKKLPKPTGGRFFEEQAFVAATGESEEFLARTLGDVLKFDRVSAESHFFNDLGANSLLMARFCARLRQNPRMSNVSMRDIYMHPTVAKLADHLDHSAIEGFIATKPEPFHTPSDFDYYLCGTLQVAFYAAYALLGLWVLDTGLEWAAAATDTLSLYLRAVAFAAGSFVALTGLSIAGKWLLVGKFKAQSIPIWSLAYFRFWAVKNLIRSAPVMVFSGTPIYNAYLRLLGARIGRNVIISCRFGPVATDLISIGDDVILRKDTIILGYRAQSNFIHTGSIEIGSHAFVGEASVIDIDTVMGDRTQLGHASSLQSGQRVPDGKRYHGSPAVETKADYCPIEAKECSTLRRTLYSATELAGLCLVAVPLPIVLYQVWENYSAAAGVAIETSTTMLLLASAGWFFGSLLAALAGVYAIPRLCHLFLTPGRTYVAFGFHYWLQAVILRVSNSEILNLVFGDSSFIVSYMRFIGWNLNKVEQTGSNFGTNQRHDNPFLCNIGSGTMVSDGLSMINMQKSATSFRLEESRIGDNNYLGNDIFYPPQGHTGANCLLATKVMIPIDGPVRENVGLLGSPCFEIPRMVERDRDAIGALDAQTRARLLRRKNVHNAVTAGLYLASRWMAFFAAVLIWSAALANYQTYGVLALGAASAATMIGSIVYYVLVERASLAFGRLKPSMVTIYDPEFWSHERHWKLADTPIVRMFHGTPIKTMIYRMVGLKIGRKVYDCSRSITERTLTEIGDYANLNEGCVIQAHSLEEGVFKSDFIRMGKGCTLGPGSFVHYGVTMGDHVVIDADSFLMKGETLDSHTGWRGNPAKMVRGGVRREQENSADTAWQDQSFVPAVAAE